MPALDKNNTKRAHTIIERLFWSLGEDKFSVFGCDSVNTFQLAQRECVCTILDRIAFYGLRVVGELCDETVCNEINVNGECWEIKIEVNGDYSFNGISVSRNKHSGLRRNIGKSFT